MSKVTKILNMCNKHFFLRNYDIDRNGKCMRLGPVGDLLRHNILKEWTLANIIGSENIYPFYASPLHSNKYEVLQEQFSHSKLLSSNKLPFGISVQTSDVFLSSSNHPELENSNKQTVLKTYVFLSNKESEQYLNEWQQKRKLWWRQLAANPGWFNVTEITRKDKSCQVQISADFPWGTHCLERISLNEDLQSYRNSDGKFIFQVESGRKKNTPDVLVSCIGLENAVTAFLLDAYDESSSVSSRVVMRFCRKIAPYKLSFTISSQKESARNELHELAQFLATQLSKVGITFMFPGSSTSVQSQYSHNDELGIPYTIVLSDSSLKNGIVGLRSRDTTLHEQVHITDLKKYVSRLFKNY